MEMIESIVWIMTGLISTLVPMEVAWRLTKAKTRKVSVTKPITMEQVLDIILYFRFVSSECSVRSRNS